MEVSHIQRFHFKIDEVFKVHISTNPKTNSLKIKSFSEGEYAQNIGFHFTEGNKEMRIEAVFPENLSGGYDKLSAHKVFSVRLEIEIPENKIVVIQSNLASVYGNGNYKSFEAELNSGRCELTHFSGKAILCTFKGDIEVQTKERTVEAISNHGEVHIDTYFKKGDDISLKSIDGDINVKHEK
ncbi:hypothetical protein ACFQ3R_00615 [Mesonia ostreae]|uniref:Adhesin domain-containing protein n=1 Tax=Mesonia ostreae TaxID=861110 RepID=A0ABU2KJB2_9FLAO|nr:hypothetical protein [Mesonia ostreae]MDT0294806.1 hypothetical protein [Mesonia ostreae]